MDSIFNASLGGDTGRTSVTREAFSAKHAFASRIRTHMSMCYGQESQSAFCGGLAGEWRGREKRQKPAL